MLRRALLIVLATPALADAAPPDHDGACTAGDAAACVAAGAQHEADATFDASVHAYQRACDLGAAAGCAALGTLYRRGWAWKGVPRDTRHAAALFKQACDGNVAPACDDLGLLLTSDPDVPRDLAEAVRVFRKACDGKAFHGCTSLGYSYQVGNFVARDLGAARGLYLQACDGGDYQGCDNTALLDERLTPPAAAHALMMFERGCALHSGYGCRRAGEAYRAAHDRRASARFATACALHESDACYAWCELNPGPDECMKRALGAAGQ